MLFSSREPLLMLSVGEDSESGRYNCQTCAVVYLQECRMPFGSGNFFEHDGLPYCETHFHAHRGSLCAGCHKPVTGRCITAMYRKYHPEHFVCSFCQCQLNKGTFKEEKDKPYCHPCFVRLFSWLMHDLYHSFLLHSYSSSFRSSTDSVRQLSVSHPSDAKFDFYWDHYSWPQEIVPLLH